MIVTCTLLSDASHFFATFVHIEVNKMHVQSLKKRYHEDTTEVDHFLRATI